MTQLGIEHETIRLVAQYLSRQRHRLASCDMTLAIEEIERKDGSIKSFRKGKYRRGEKQM
jgi:hypothetical protein